MSTALAVAPDRGRALIVADALVQEADQRKLLGQYVASQMSDGSDYGIIPGTLKRTLLKPGAEKLVSLFKCAPKYVIEEKIEDWKTSLFFYRFSCQILTLSDGAVVAEGVGSCSTYESRYRWRTAARKCPACGTEAIIKGKAEYGGGWLCFKKKDGCGGRFADGDPVIESQSVGRVENPDLADAANTVLKIAKKRALVDASISLARCSDIFTQDVEDFGHSEPSPAVPRDVAAEFRAAPTLEALAEIWKRLSTEEQSRYLGAKDRRKAELTKAGEQRPDPTPTTEPPESNEAAFMALLARNGKA